MKPKPAGLVTLGVDIGQSCGWAVFVGGKLTASGTLKLPKRLSHEDALRRIATLLDKYGPDLVAIEDVAFSKFPLAHASYWRLRTLWELAIERTGRKIPTTFPAVKTLKLWATGSGNANKIAMCVAARKRYGVELYAQPHKHKKKPTEHDARKGTKAQEDEADAILVAGYAVAMRG